MHMLKLSATAAPECCCYARPGDDKHALYLTSARQPAHDITAVLRERCH